MKEVRLDLFKLHEENDKGQGRIKVVLNNKLRKIVEDVIQELLQNGIKISSLAKLLCTRYDTFYHDLNNHKKLSLCLIENLINLWSKMLNKSIENIEKTKSEILDSITELTYGAGNTHKVVRSPRTLTIELCKIAGAIIADGNLHKPKIKQNFPHYIIDIKDQYKDGLDKFSEWIEKEFREIKKAKRDEKKNLWRISFGNKIIYRYLSNLFKIPTGNKHLIVEMPELVKNFDIKYKIGFILGVAMFDGGIGFRRPYLNISSVSRKLLEDLRDAMRELRVDPDSFPENSNKNGVYEIRIYRKEKLRKCLGLFLEKDSTKWKQLNLLINGPERDQNLNDLLGEINDIFPKVKTAIKYTELIKLIEENKGIKLTKLEELSNKNKKLLYEYLENLERWKLISSSRNGIYKVWSLNPNLKLSNGGDRE